MTDGSVEEPPVPPGVDPEVPSPARLYDYYLGGRINYRADREAAERIRADLPYARVVTWTTTPQWVRTGLAEYAKTTEHLYLRSRAEVLRLFAGLDLVPPWPGEPPRLVFLGEWGAEDPASADSDGSHWGYAGVGRVPGE